MRYAIVVAAGQSLRYGGNVNKLDELLLGKTVLQHSVDALLGVADVVVAVGRHVPGTLFAKGGETRMRSVFNGLQALPQQAEGVVAVHDGARPFASRQFAERLFCAAERYGSAVPRLPVSDTLYRTDGPSPQAADRSGFFTVQTPQVFDLALLRRAYRHALERELAYTDDSALFAADGNAVHFEEGQRGNIKLTYEGDMPCFRTGIGFDVHPFAAGSGVRLGGVTVPFCKKLAGHSDADVLCHALCDALLSASGNRDIGHLFPDTDPAYAGVDSTLLLAECVAKAESQGWEVVNASATVICQQPKIAPYAAAIEARLAELLHVPAHCVNLSATTTEHLGALGNGDGIAAEASVLLRAWRA